MRHGGEHAEDRQLAHVALAELALQSPDRDPDMARHAKALLDLRQQRSVTLQHGAGAGDAARRDARRYILLEGFFERAALAAVEGEHAHVLLHAAERLADDILRDAGACSLGR